MVGNSIGIEKESVGSSPRGDPDMRSNKYSKEVPGSFYPYGKNDPVEYTAPPIYNWELNHHPAIFQGTRLVERTAIGKVVNDILDQIIFRDFEAFCGRGKDTKEKDYAKFNNLYTHVSKEYQRLLFKRVTPRGTTRFEQQIVEKLLQLIATYFGPLPGYPNKRSPYLNSSFLRLIIGKLDKLVLEEFCRCREGSTSGYNKLDKLALTICDDFIEKSILRIKGFPWLVYGNEIDSFVLRKMREYIFKRLVGDSFNHGRQPSRVVHDETVNGSVDERQNQDHGPHE